jgi:alkylhydroperoxidase family enzyme
LRYADAITQTPAVIPDNLFNELKAHFSSAQLVELTAAIAWENYRARFNHAFGAESEGFSEAAYCALPVHAPH